MLPNINADDGDVRQERVLVGRRHDLERLGLGVIALHHEDKKTMVLRSTTNPLTTVDEHVRASPNRNPGWQPWSR